VNSTISCNFVSAIFITGVLACGTALAGPGERCQGVKGEEGDLVIDTATFIEPAPTWVPVTDSSYAPVPAEIPMCRLAGRIEGTIGIEVWLPVPDKWNRRLLGAGVGGDAGRFNYTDMGRRLNEGFVTYSTDSGHKASNARWMTEPKARVDYEHRATHLSALAAKHLSHWYYGEAPQHSYYLGCSGGGRQGLKEMQKYPDDFDGIVSGAPGPYMPLQSVRMMWFALEQKHNPDAALTDADWDLYEQAVTRKCDMDDGVADGIIENPAGCEFDTGSLACRGDIRENCLSEPKIEMLNEIVVPMVDEQGRPMDFGLYPGVRTRPGPPSPLLRAMWADAVYDDPDWDEETFQRTRDLDRVNEVMPDLRADNPEIGNFIARGGKAIIYQGWWDPSVVAGPTLDYYRALTKTQGGIDRLSDSVRLFMVPGMYHCRRGPGADQFGGSGQVSWNGDPQRDILWALIRWVEEDVAPNRLKASKMEGDETVFTRTLCPFPERAYFTGEGDNRDANAYQCKADAALSAILE